MMDALRVGVLIALAYNAHAWYRSRLRYERSMGKLDLLADLARTPAKA